MKKLLLVGLVAISSLSMAASPKIYVDGQVGYNSALDFSIGVAPMWNVYKNKTISVNVGPVTRLSPYVSFQVTSAGAGGSTSGSNGNSQNNADATVTNIHTGFDLTVGPKITVDYKIDKTYTAYGTLELTPGINLDFDVTKGKGAESSSNDSGQTNSQVKGNASIFKANFSFRGKIGGGIKYKNYYGGAYLGSIIGLEAGYIF